MSKLVVDYETGNKGDRAEFQAMFRNASQHKFDLLLFGTLDRSLPDAVIAFMATLAKQADAFGAGSYDHTASGKQNSMARTGSTHYRFVPRASN